MTSASVEHWDNAQVAYFPEGVSAEQSLASLERRNGMYPGLLELMPVEYPDKLVLDFGCGPGHDTIMFLLNGAKHVYAVDASWQGLTSLWNRLRAHELEERCTLIRVGEGEHWRLPPADHVHCAGVLHHIADPVSVLKRFLWAISRSNGDIRLMVYAAESQFVQAHGGPEGFEEIADGAAPIAKAWTKAEVRKLAKQAHLKATYKGGYLMGETKGPGLGGCWSLVPA